MGKKAAIGVLVSIGLGAFLSLWTAPVPLVDLLKQPLRSLWGSHQHLEDGVLEVSENMDSVQEATRRLLKPFGVVRLTRLLPVAGTSENSSRNSK